MCQAGAVTREEQQAAAVAAFWEDARVRAGLNPVRVYTGPTVAETVPPPSWSYGSSPAEADAFVEQVLAGQRSATTSALRDHGTAGPPEDATAGHGEAPEPGGLSILLDGSGRPRALLSTVVVRVVPFDRVEADHALAEGLPSLQEWRAVTRSVLEREPGGFAEDLPVVLERFEVLVPRDRRRARAARQPAPVG